MTLKRTSHASCPLATRRRRRAAISSTGSKKHLQEFKTEQDKVYYERKCSALDKSIDSEVYKLYGLTEEEIKIVEGQE